ncbi:MAG TPA: hypothetical protein VF891_00800 [Gaiellaceae bacterium]
MRAEFEKLVAFGPLPASDELDEATTRRYGDAISALPEAPTADEAVALIDLFPPDESTAFGLVWSILHKIESSPDWPIWSALDDRNSWVTRLRLSCERAGFYPPD